eukprot:4874520-Pleurochrysis_carterae.AAC.2
MAALSAECHSWRAGGGDGNSEAAARACLGAGGALQLPKACHLAGLHELGTVAEYTCCGEDEKAGEQEPRQEVDQG